MIKVVKVRTNGIDASLLIPPDVRDVFKEAGHATVKQIGKSLVYTPITGDDNELASGREVA